MHGMVYSVVASPAHPRLSDLYARLGLTELRFDSQRKAIAALREQAPDWVVADFIYGFSTYYQATNVSNLDVLLHSLVKYACDARVIVLVGKDEREHVEKLRAIHPLHAVLTYPVGEADIASLMESAQGTPPA
jgi:DNA-binding NarL/FixJ family response regulator